MRMINGSINCPARRRAVHVALVLTLLMGSCAIQAAQAQSPAVVPAGESVVLARTEQAITETKVTLGALASGTQDKTNFLVYIAPERATDGQQAVVTYKAGGDTKLVSVSIRDPAPTLTDPQFYTASFKALFGLFILAVVVESGLALIFRWPPFLDFFDSRSTNAIVAFIFSYIFVQLFNLDIATTLVNIYSGTKYPVSFTGLVLTAMIIAGGSAGVRRMLQTFGFRPPAAADEPPPAPPPNEAWIAVTLIRQRAVGPVSVQIGAPGQVAIAGTITGTGRRSGVFRYFLRDKGRFPNSGGYRITPGQYEIRLSGVDAAGNTLSPAPWGPAQIGNRALVDVQFRL